MKGGREMKICQNCGAKNDDLNNHCCNCAKPFLRVLRSAPTAPLVVKRHPLILYVVFGVIALIILLAGAVVIGSTIGSPVDSAKGNPSEIVDSSHNINVGYLQNLAASGLTSIRSSSGLPDESVIDMRYDVVADGTCYIEITYTTPNGNVAYFVQGKPQSSDPAAVGAYKGQVMISVTAASIAHGTLSIQPILQLSHKS